MRRIKNNSRGFTLIAALLIMVLLSGVAAGLLYLVTDEVKMSGNDLENNLAYYGAQSGMEKLTADLSALYETTQNPSNTQIQALTGLAPSSSMVGAMNYTETITYSTNASGAPASTYATIASGDEQGLYAQTIPMTLNVIATRPSGASVNMTRQIEVALIPVFQYGVFCTYDCAFMPGPDYSFGGRVHANGNVFLGGAGDMVFNNKISAGKRIIMEYFEDGYAASSGLNGRVYVPNAAGGCPLHTFPPTGSNCIELPSVTTVPGDASWSGGIPPAGTANTNFPSLSAGTFNGYLSDTTTGAGDIEMNFVQNNCNQNPPPCTDPISIIRKPLAGEGPTGALPQSRMYNKAQIRVLLADTVADLHPERGASPLSDGQDIQLYSSGNTSYTVPLTSGTGTEYLGVATVSGATTSPYWVAPYINNSTCTATAASGWTSYPLHGEVTTCGPPANGQGAWIRVEYLNNSGTWVGVTTEWLNLGFGRQYNTQLTAPYGSSSGTTNTVNPQAILILQQLRASGLSPTGAGTSGNWYPINFYDTREGEMRDTSQAAGSCSVNGIMNAVELDVGNLALWLKGTTGSSGTNVNYTNQNGYILYFSDHRGSITDPNPSNGGQTPAGVISGESGLEDVVNASSATGLPPNGTLEPASYYSFSPEDSDMNGKLDNWGEVNIGYGFGMNTNTSPLNSYVRITSNCNQVGQANAVTGARHVLKLVDGGMSSAAVSYLPMMPSSTGCSFTSSGSGCGGFTVASENPVYIQGDYNSSQYDPFWGTYTSASPSNNTPHAAASIVADAVTILSNSWSDLTSLTYPTAMTSRPATTTHYRVAVASGSNIAFPLASPISITNGGWTIGTDGGEIEILHYLEDWTPSSGGQQTIWYLGSLVNFWHSEYDTGTYKCCITVYSPGQRNYDFDSLFLNPANLPPGTPALQDIDNLSYHQNFTPQ